MALIVIVITMNKELASLKERIKKARARKKRCYNWISQIEHVTARFCASNMKVRRTLKGHFGILNTCRFLNEQQILTTLHESTVMLWDITKKRSICRNLIPFHITVSKLIISIFGRRCNRNNRNSYEGTLRVRYTWHAVINYKKSLLFSRPQLLNTKSNINTLDL